MTWSEKWTIGHSIPEDEAEDFFELHATNEVVSATTHPTPGGYYSDPYEGDHFFVTHTGLAFSQEANEEEDPPIFHGHFSNDDELIDLVVKFIINGDHEIAAAAYFHFDESKFENWKNDWVRAIPVFYWFTCQRNSSNFPLNLKSALEQKSKVFKYFKKFFEEPDNSSFAHIRREIDSAQSLESSYWSLKYHQN